ncbi:hypothetical protein ACAW74_08500 [Fibrella sp. WM1]|uniref:hypothetical protein n=1 Tax=Fibrella musci TaxID=3242485 RepID=UPI003520E12E
MKTNLLLLGTVLFPVLLHAQTNTEKPSDDERKRLDTELPKLDKAAGQFNPAFFNDARHQHQALTVSVTNGVYTPVRRVVRPGKLPFSQEMGAPFGISFIGTNGKRLGGYSIQMPETVRSCESQRVGPRSPTGTFTFEVLLPNDPAIQQLELTGQGKRIATLRLPPNQPPTNRKP